jgi:Arc/MetJ-type ribon-helix-helix transcriptional regulator
MSKRRLSTSIDGDLVDAAERAVSEGLAENVSAWVNAALRVQAEHDARTRALDVFIGDYEQKHGPITHSEIEAITKRARASAEIVRGPAKRRRRAA